MPDEIKLELGKKFTYLKKSFIIKSLESGQIGKPIKCVSFDGTKVFLSKELALKLLIKENE
jgi:hypothetical protein